MIDHALAMDMRYNNVMTPSPKRGLIYGSITTGPLIKIRTSSLLPRTKTVCKETPLPRPDARNKRAMRRWYRVGGVKRVYTTVPGDVYWMGGEDNILMCHPDQEARIRRFLTKEGFDHA